MSWAMSFDPLGNLVLSSIVAAVPIFFLFWALAVKGLKGHVTSIGATLIAVFIAIMVYGMPSKLAALATLSGMLFGLWPIAWIVVCAVFLYNLSVATGQFSIIKNSLASVTGDRRLQTLLVAFSFGAFLEGAAGFGTPVAIAGAMLAGLGFDPLKAAGLCLIANASPVPFGAVGVAIIVGGQVSGLDQVSLGQLVGRTLPVLSLLMPWYLVVLLAGWRRALEVWPAILVCGGSFALAQWLTAEYLGPMLPDVLAGIVSVVALAVFLTFWHPAVSWKFPGETGAEKREVLLHSYGEVFRAWTPFLILLLTVGVLGIKSAKAALDLIASFQIPIAGLDQAVVRGGKAMPAVFSLNLLTASGSAILLAAVFSLPVMGASFRLALEVFVKTLKTLRFTILGIAFILGFASIMNYSGMAITLGNAFVATGPAFLLFSPFLGWLGVFMTGSDTSSVALFGKLQEVSATKLGINPVIAVAANASGGGCGKMISPQALSIATAATGQVGREGALFRFTIKHSIILTAVIALIVFLQGSLLSATVPAVARTLLTAPVTTAPASSEVNWSSFPGEGVGYLAANAMVILALIISSRRLSRRRA